MTLQDKIDLINTLHYKKVDYDADGQCLYYVYIPIDDETINVLNQLGYDEEEINSMTEDNEINLAPIGFEFADWWYSDKGFSLEVPEEYR